MNIIFMKFSGVSDGHYKDQSDLTGNSEKYYWSIADPYRVCYVSALDGHFSAFLPLASENSVTSNTFPSPFEFQSASFKPS